MLKHYEQHEREAAHLESVFKLQLFKLENGIPSVKENETHPVSEYNSLILICIVDAICFVIKLITSNFN